MQTDYFSRQAVEWRNNHLSRSSETQARRRKATKVGLPPKSPLVPYGHMLVRKRKLQLHTFERREVRLWYESFPGNWTA